MSYLNIANTQSIVRGAIDGTSLAHIEPRKGNADRISQL